MSQGVATLHMESTSFYVFSQGAQLLYHATLLKDLCGFAFNLLVNTYILHMYYYVQTVKNVYNSLHMHVSKE